MEEELRIGVFVCMCGVNIAAVVDVEEVANYASTLDDVVVTDVNQFTCSAPGQNSIAEAIKEKNLNRVVVAACSPKMHEPTFRNACEEAGLNPFLFEMVNIREHSSWVHPDNPVRATEKAKILVEMGVAKARYLEPIEKTLASVKEKILVVGGGVAGLRASIDAAERDMQVTLLEKSPTLGGKAARIGDLVHSEKAGHEIAQDLIQRAVNNPNISIETNSQLEEVKGAFGEYTATIKKNPRYVLDSCSNPEKGEEVCPVDVPNEYEFNLSSRKAIYKPFKGAYPDKFVIDMDTCTKCDECVKACDEGSIDLHAEPEYVTDEFGTIIVTTGYDPYEPKVGEYGYQQDPKVITLLQLERILDHDEPEFASIGVAPDVKNIVFISCVGSMQDPSIKGANTYCSRMCCSSSLKNMIRMRKIYPDANIFYLYRDIRTYARREEKLYEDASKDRIMFIRWERDDPPLVETNGSLNVDIFDDLINQKLRIPADLVVLAQGMVPTKDYKATNEILKLPCTTDGWIAEAHAKLRPVEIPSPGIYIAGAAQAPRDIIESVTSASAASAKAVVPILKGEVFLEPLTSEVNQDTCGACGVCITTCPYEAISRIELNGRKVANVDARLCQGCGQCAAACPSGAMQQKSYTDQQMYSMLDVVM